MHDNYTALDVSRDSGVAHVTFNHPPVNMLDATLIGELGRFVAEVAEDTDVRVVVFQSANPDFFLAHVDFNFMEHPEEFAALSHLVPGDGTLTPMQSLALAIRALPQVTIAKLRGRLRGGGNELAMAADLRYAALGETWLSQIESRLGIIPGGGGSTMLTQLVGRSRALEAILSGDLYDARTAELYGWINLAIEPDQLDSQVNGLARRIASRSPQQIKAAKAVTTVTPTDDLATRFGRELEQLGALYPAPEPIVEMIRRAVADGAQTRAGELDLEGAIEHAAATI